ncbi:RNase adapter RapZ [Roseinatronobacter alkalisoli]|uniref:RNase adapter RapZ n=1 Tax=Roseinatronobacter alkalisoli TaxID=3028235 RepID=A0ABT5T4A4_9RHOB|nr:RNase adapter RapZ [Roseinatronobacter sp. HJB301]MDD7969879.1 RNase adapter RapZ [Roseinatronobacter sp. HJB301]
MSKASDNTSQDDGFPQDAERLILITGPAGSGRSTALKALEDVGFEAIDNMPSSLVPRLVRSPLPRPLALGIDTRNRDFSVNSVLTLVEMLAGLPGLDFELVYLDCAPGTLIRRFSETRRRHPLRPDAPVRDGVELELNLLAPMRQRADVLIDTNAMTPHDLRAEIHKLFDRDGQGGMHVQIQSFSFKRGLPAAVDMVFDCRFLQNPHWNPDLRAFDGRDPKVAAFVASDPRFGPFFERVLGMVESLLPEFAHEGKSHLTIAFGCTGGRHRSVATAEKLVESLAQTKWRVSKRHRELERVSALLPKVGKDE